MKRAALALGLVAVLFAGGLSLLAQENRGGRRAPASLYDTHMYDVRDLVFTIRDYPPQVNMELVPSGGFGFGMFEEEEGELLAYYEGDLLVDMIMENVAPASWEELRSVSIVYTNGILTVRHTPAVHERIAQLLDALRARVGNQVRVDAAWIRISDAALRQVFGGGSRFVLDAAAEKRLEAAIAAEDARVVTAGTILCANTQRVAITDVTQVSYLQDYDVEIAEESMIADPIAQTLNEGVVADVRPTIAGNGSVVVLEVRADAARLHRPIETSVTDVGEIELPITDLMKVRTSVAVPVGQTAVIGGTHSGKDGEGLILFLRTELVSGKGK